MRDQRLWCFCAYLFPVRAYGDTLTTGCLSNMNRLKSPERTLCLFFPVLSVFPPCSLSSLILFFLSAITPHEGPLWDPGVWNHFAYHNRERTSHICKLALASWTGFQVFQQGERKSALQNLSSQQRGLRVKCMTQSDLIRFLQSFTQLTPSSKISDASPLCLFTDLKCWVRSHKDVLSFRRYLWAVRDLLIITLICFFSKFFPWTSFLACLSFMRINVIFVSQPEF